MGERGRERTLQEGTVKAHNRALMLRVETRTGKRLGAQKHIEHGLELNEEKMYNFPKCIEYYVYYKHRNGKNKVPPYILH